MRSGFIKDVYQKSKKRHQVGATHSQSNKWAYTVGHAQHKVERYERQQPYSIIAITRFTR